MAMSYWIGLRRHFGLMKGLGRAVDLHWIAGVGVARKEWVVDAARNLERMHSFCLVVSLSGLLRANPT